MYSFPIPRAQQDARLVVAAQQLVTVDPAVALWALERAAEREFGPTGAAAMFSMSIGFDELYRATGRSAGEFEGGRLVAA